jgi:hypothetical protein
VAVSNNDNAWQCILQKAAPAGNFTDIGYQPANSSGQYVFTDFADMTAVYRAKLICRSGVVVYSPVIRFNGVKNDQQLQVDVFPNPATATVNIQLYLPETGVCGITISDGGGRKLQELQKMMRKGINSFSLAVNELPAGLYFIKISGNYKTATRIFVKSPR